MQSPLPAVVPGMQHRSDIRPLNAKQIRFEIDMCIGCDRCMLACPIPSSSGITIAELNAATVGLTGTFTPHIADFTETCVMCGSCVPVCPVGNHRDLLMLSLKQRLGASWNRSVDVARVQSGLPAGVPLLSLLAALRAQPLFSDPQAVPDAYLLHLVAEASVEICDAGRILFREGDFGRDIFFILDGQIELSSADAGGAALPLALYGRGEYVGDYGMLTGQPHYATATVGAPGALLLVVREQSMQRLIELVPAVHHYFERNASSLEVILKRLPLFAGLSDDALRWLAQQTRTRRYERDEQLFAEEEQRLGNGANADVREALHIVLEGFIKVSRRTAMGTGRAKGDERVIAYRQRGDYFAGGLDLPVVVFQTWMELEPTAPHHLTCLALLCYSMHTYL